MFCVRSLFLMSPKLLDPNFQLGSLLHVHSADLKRRTRDLAPKAKVLRATIAVHRGKGRENKSEMGGDMSVEGE